MSWVLFFSGDFVKLFFGFLFEERMSYRVSVLFRDVKVWVYKVVGYSGRIKFCFYIVLIFFLFFRNI